MKQVTILGSTGSIGQSTLDVIRTHPEAFSVTALTARQNVAGLFRQCQEFSPTYAVMADEESAFTLTQLCREHGLGVEVLAGSEALLTVAQLPEVDIVMAAIVGSAGLASSLAAAKSGKRLLLANKEALVMAGSLFMDAVREHGALLLPIDSEHNAIFQCMPQGYACHQGEHDGIKQIILTASGGPFRCLPVEQLKQVTVEQACAHPNWNMGQKISIDSATMMNKGLELIEAHFLFNVDEPQLSVALHPESIVHSMVYYNDGSVLAQLGNPDMRTPIAYGLAWPRRIKIGVEPVTFHQQGSLTFEPMDLKHYPCLSLAWQALRQKGTAPTILNAANEVAVDAFIAGKINFTDIANYVDATLQHIPTSTIMNMETILEADARARQYTSKLMATSGA